MSTIVLRPSDAIAAGLPCLDVAGLAALLGCTRHHVLHQLAKRPSFPQPFIHISNNVCYWRASDILAWLHCPGVRALTLADLDAPRLDTAGIADLLGCTRQHAAAIITKRTDFPPPCINISNRMRSWLYRDVLAWLAPHASRSDSDTCAAVPKILDIDAVATLLGCTRKHASHRLTTRADFPQPFLYASRRLRWWRASDVQAWLETGGAA